MKTKLLVSLGCPRGIGPEVTQAAIAAFGDDVDITVLGPSPHPRARSIDIGVAPGDHLRFQYVALQEMVRRAADYDALVTGPIQKNALPKRYGGHTEFLHEHLAKDAHPPLMAFVKERGMVLGLATIHVPLAEVATVLSREIYQSCAQRLVELCQMRGVKRPRLVALGVNPHAGEGGRLGLEEIEVLRPALRNVHGADVIGPVPADGFFASLGRGEEEPDALLAAYHDQGLAPFKLLAKGSSVNTTLGLTLPRTSPDHGTAAAIAGKGIADPTSMKRAFSLAVELATKSQGQSGRRN